MLLLLSATVVAQPRLEVSIEGVEDKLLDNVRLLLSIEQQKESTALVEGRIHRLHQKAPEEIRKALEPFGYYRVTVGGSLLFNDDVWQARYQINRGAPVLITQTDISLSGEAQDDPDFIAIIQQQPLQHQKPFIHSDYEQLKGTLLQLADEKGYFAAQFTQSEVRVDPASYSASVALHFDSGPRFRFGDITFTGEHPFAETFLLQYPGFSPGDDYLHRLVAELHKALVTSGYFETVDIKADRDSATNQQVPITITLKTRPRNHYQFGLGYGSDTGLRGMAGYERRWLNAKGHRLSTELRLSEIRNSVAVQHTVPLSRPQSDRWINRAEYKEDSGGDVDSYRTLLSSRIERVHGNWQHQWELNYLQENFEIGLQNDESSLLFPAIRWNSIRGYDLLNLVHGVRIGLELRGATKKIISDSDFVQTRIETKSIVPLGRGRILLRGEAAATAVESVEELPPSLRFFAGGDNSIRGFGYRKIGPTDASGEVVGGRHLLVGSIEYDYPLNELWRTALFLDGGNVFNDQFIEAEKGAGIGIRRILPIGQLRIDLAQAISDPERPWRLHITMGLEL